jgi:hypothetical protein
VDCESHHSRLEEREELAVLEVLQCRQCCHRPATRDTEGVPERPSVLLWLRYALGGTLPARYDEWTYHDLTGPDWRIREAGRIMLFAVVPIVALLCLPGPLDIRIYCALFVVLGPLFVGFAYGDELRDRRLRQHGMLPPNGPDPD